MDKSIAIYSTYCGTTANMTWCGSKYSMYPSYFISNNPEVLDKVSAAGWIPIFMTEVQISSNSITSTMQGKLAKVLPHQIPVLEQYKALCFIDDKHTVNEAELSSTVEKLLSSDSMIGFKKHPFIKPNVLLEYTECLKQPRYAVGRDQIVAYIADQVDAGLKLTSNIHYAGTCIIRNMQHPKIKEFNLAWMEHIKKCGIEDQISLFFLAQQFPNIMTLPNTVFSSTYSWA